MNVSDLLQVLAEFGSVCGGSQVISLTETVGDCRYPGGNGYDNYETISGDDATTLQACLDYCASDTRCHAMDYHTEFQRVCWLFENAPGSEHTGNGLESSRCSVKNNDAYQEPCATATEFIVVASTEIADDADANVGWFELTELKLFADSGTHYSSPFRSSNTVVSSLILGAQVRMWPPTLHRWRCFCPPWTTARSQT